MFSFIKLRTIFKFIMKLLINLRLFSMKVLQKIAEVKQTINQLKENHTKIAFVPTMGALHQGHLELLKIAKNYSDFVVLSIYVNPTQFGKNEDFDKYPRNLQQDIDKIQQQNISIDLVFAPTNHDIYPFPESPILSFPFLSQKLCGISRPTHFDGVGLVVLKLLNIIQPDFLIMGQKDFQQTVIIQRLIDEFFLDTKLIIVPTVREKDGLALSSRNVYLNSEEREQALILFKTLTAIQNQLKTNMNVHEIQQILEGHRNFINLLNNVKLDYLEILDAKNLQPIALSIEKGMKIVVAIAVFVGKTRLIDNFVIEF